MQLAINAPFGLLWVADKTNPVVHAFDMSVRKLFGRVASSNDGDCLSHDDYWRMTTSAEIQFQNRIKSWRPFGLKLERDKTYWVILVLAISTGAVLSRVLMIMVVGGNGDQAKGAAG